MADPVVNPTVKSNWGSRLSLNLDLTPPTCAPEDCSSLLNTIRRKGRSFAKRPGAKMVAGNEINDSGLSYDLFCGVHNYTYANSAQGESEETLFITGGQNARVYVLGEGSIVLSRTGGGSLDIQPGTISDGTTTQGVWVITLYNSFPTPATGWPKNFGDGVINTGLFGHALAGSTIDDLITAINATAGWTASSSSTTSDKASVAQIGTTFIDVPVSDPGSIPFSNIKDPVAAPTTAVKNVGVDVAGYQNLKGVNAANVMYFPMGKKLPITKYDGQLACRPGLPRGLLSGVADTGSGATFAAASSYIYRIGFWRVDNRGNQIYGPYSDDTLSVAEHTVGGSPSNITLSFFPLNRAALGSDEYDSLAFDPRAAKVSGAQTGVTSITVDSGNQLQIGDAFYFLNRATSAYETRTVTGRSDTSVTFAVACNVNDDDILSNIRVQIQRTEDTGIDFFEVANVPNNSLLSAAVAQTYVDSTADTALGEAIEDQIKLPEPPPNARFCCIHQGLVVYANLEDDPIGFTWNDPEWGYEAYPTATNRDQAITARGGEITGIISESDASFAIFKKESYIRIEGDLSSGQYTINEVATDGIGIVSGASLVKSEDAIRGLSKLGPVMIKDGRMALDNVGISSLFYDSQFDLERSSGVFWSDQKVILFFIPLEGGSDATVSNTCSIKRYSGTSSFWLCYDVKTQEWREWQTEYPDERTYGTSGETSFSVILRGINAHLGMLESQDTVYFISSNLFDGSTAPAGSTNYIWKFLDGSDSDHYADLVYPTKHRIRLSYEALSLANQEKSMPQLKVYNRNAADLLTPGFTLTINEYRDDYSLAPHFQDTPYTSTTRAYTFVSVGTGPNRTTGLAADTKERLIDCVPGDFIANSIEFYNEELLECSLISGFDLFYKIKTSPEPKGEKGTG